MNLQNLENFGAVQHERAADEAAVRRVIAVNEHAILINDADLYVKTFAPEAVVEWWDAAAAGAEEIRRYFKLQQENIALRDVIVNLVIEINDNRALAIGSGFVIPVNQKTPQMLATMTVSTELAKNANGNWAIVRQSKIPDASFDRKIGTLNDVVERLEKRVETLESAAQNSGDKNIETELVAVETKLREAVLSGDRQALADLLDEDFAGIGFAGQSVDKNLYAEVHTNPQDPFVKFEVEHTQIRIFKDFALISGVQDVTAAIHLKSRYVCGLVRRNDVWKIVYWQETGIVDPQIFTGN